jgi:hypothetical protein
MQSSQLNIARLFNPDRRFTHIGRRDGIVTDGTSRRTEDDDPSVRGVLDVIILDQRVCA